MKLEKTKRKIKNQLPPRWRGGSQLQNQKQVQNVVVNLPVMKSSASRKRKPKILKTSTKQGPNKTHFQSPIYMPPVVSYNPKQDNNFLLTEIMKHVKGVSAPTASSSNNQIEKPKVSDEQIALDQIQQVQPSLPQAFNTSAPPNRSLSLVQEMQSDTSNDHRTLVKPVQFEAKQEPFKFKPSLNFSTVELKEQKKRKVRPSAISIVKMQPSATSMDQQWAELETGGHFGLLGINSQQLKDHKDAKRAFTFEALSLPTLTEEPRPTSEEIDLGMVSQEAGLIVQEDRVESNEPPINLEPLSMGASQSFTREFIPSAEDDDEFAESSDIRGVSDAEVAKDTQEFLDFMKTLNLSTGSSTRSIQGAELLSPTKEPTLAEKLNMPRAESRFASPEAPEALAELLVLQAKSKKVNSNTDSRLQVADFRNKPELMDAIKLWNKENPTRKITTQKADKKGSLTIDELEFETIANGLTFTALKKNTQKKAAGTKI
jgi:hypothetical protein